jgi:catechol 2,3-dioxygenase-like lactoylglutathione lyase family enzyme
MSPRLVPELDVEDLDRSLWFYTEILGFRVRFDRPDERFAYLDLDGAELMLEEASGPGRRFRTAPLEHPYGRGVNLQIEVADVDALLHRLALAGIVPLMPREERWYETGSVLSGNRQFVVSDPDGYLLRFFTDLGERSSPPDSD